MRLRRLGWAGIELEAAGEHLVIDHLLDGGGLAAFLNDQHDELIAPDPASARAALVTHLHRDHTDVAAIERVLAPGGELLRPAAPGRVSELERVSTGEAEDELERSGLEVRPCSVGDRVELGPFSVSAHFASDGLGSRQLSWLVEADGERVFHGGDTLWHGAWWEIAAAYGAVDVACLPANGVLVDFPQLQPPVSIPAAMSPREAVEAARALRARALVPIHHNRTFEFPGHYRPLPDATEQLEAIARELGLELRLLAPGSWQDVAVALPLR